MLYLRVARKLQSQRKFSKKVREKSGNFEKLKCWPPCKHFIDIALTFTGSDGSSSSSKNLSLLDFFFLGFTGRQSGIPLKRKKVRILLLIHFCEKNAGSLPFNMNKTHKIQEICALIQCMSSFLPHGYINTMDMVFINTWGDTIFSFLIKNMK